MSCVPSTFGTIYLFGGEIQAVGAALVTNHSASVPSTRRFTQPSVEVQDASFCNITVTYTHPGQGDSIIVEAWLPPKEAWNGRLQAVGGGGFVAGRGAIGDGYATMTTDAGLGAALDPTSWALLSPGNVNLYSLQNLASVSLDDAATITKSLISFYYGRGPEYSYWNGCSQGGRQGLMLAQRYPTAYDGIAAGAPGINWNDFFPTMLWPSQFMNMLGDYPYPCEVEAITAAAIKACDPLDGLEDGVIADVDPCLARFDPFSLVGHAINCSEMETPRITSAAAAVVNATWQGMRNVNGVCLWPGLSPGTDLAIIAAKTDCTGGACKAVPPPVATHWLSLFVARDAQLDLSNLSHVEFDRLVRQGKQRYDSIIGTNDPDISAFFNHGGKLITFHGLLDQLIPPKGTSKYFSTVSSLIPDTQSSYRHFEIPGWSHCGNGGQTSEPTSLFDQLRAWVENGTAPAQSPVVVTDAEGNARGRVICPYPQKAVLKKDCPVAQGADCWSCSI
ncbi:tannase and feruloyl esterase [Podospora aff. communis PSN243]|uniref:Carboxylic ester hydrolase n=1 Tax=Podospora aff. communis PSN243 TaxID=3040156 RepID=A0AAV9GAS3_9PEZI|nr:tannase and feruloyl esterase [Podospora aff. communis PSN243]